MPRTCRARGPPPTHPRPELTAPGASLPVMHQATGRMGDRPIELSGPSSVRTDRIEDLLTGDHPAAATGQEVEQALLDAAQVDDRGARRGPRGGRCRSPSRRAGWWARSRRSTPDERRVITIARARSSSGEKGTVRMSSTPRSNARSFVRRSPRRVRPSDRVTLCRSVLDAPSREQRGPVVMVHVDDRHVRLPAGQDLVRLGEGAGGPAHESAMVQGERDEVDDEVTAKREGPGTPCPG